MLVTIFLTAVVGLALATAALLLFGHRLHFASTGVGVVVGILWALGAGELAARLWNLPSSYVLAGEVLLAVAIVTMAVVRPRWNPIGQVFFGSYLTAVVTYLAAAVVITVDGGLPIVTAIASALLLVLEVVALALATTFAFESCDVLCRTRWERRVYAPDPDYLPKVSLQIAAYNEPPDMLIETIKSVNALDYPNFEVVVIDNNTKDPDVWRPVEDFCRDLERVHFVHVDPWPGYKSGALNLALTDYTAPDAELVGVVDADYIVDPSYLRSVVGYFVDPQVGFVQTPQDYREYEGDAYLTACYDAYKYFFVTSMPSRNERNSIIFAGTMGLLRRSALEDLGGWDEWCITEDAETSLRMLKMGFSGIFVPRPYGRGIMPLTFAALKSQRFRWCFGGMQILRRHWRELMPWDRDPQNRLSVAQRLDYLISGAQWMNDLVNLGFSLVLLCMALVFATHGTVSLRPLFGLALLLPAVLMASGLLRAVWALRSRTGITIGRSLRAFANWLSLSFTVAIACIQGLTRREGVFMRTPKESEQHRFWSAVRAARIESIIAVALWSAGVVLAVMGRANVFVVILFAWQGSIYACALWMAWLNQHTDLSAQLERRRRTELRRERRALLRPYYAGATIVTAFALALAAIFFVGGSQPAPSRDPFALPKAGAGDRGPVGNLFGGSDSSSGPANDSSTGSSTSTSSGSTSSGSIGSTPSGQSSSSGTPGTSSTPASTASSSSLPPTSTPPTTAATTSTTPTTTATTAAAAATSTTLGGG